MSVCYLAPSSDLIIKLHIIQGDRPPELVHRHHYRLWQLGRLLQHCCIFVRNLCAIKTLHLFIPILNFTVYIFPQPLSLSHFLPYAPTNLSLRCLSHSIDSTVNLLPHLPSLSPPPLPLLRLLNLL